MPQTLRLFSSQLSVSNLLTLKIFLGLTKTDRVAVWEYTDDPEAATAVLIDTDTPEGRSQVKEWVDRKKSQVLIAFSDKGIGLPNGVLLLSRPLRSADLLAVLQEAATRCTSGSAGQERGKSSGPAAQVSALLEETNTSASFTGTGRVLNFLYKNHDKALKAIDRVGRSVIFDVWRRRYYTINLTRTEVEDLLASPVRSVQIQEMSSNDLAKEIQNIKAQDSDPLFWTAALAISNGQLMLGLLLEGFYKLNRWPDLKKLGADPLHMKLAALLRSGGTIDHLAHFTKAPVENIIDFINACQVLHYLENQQKSMPSVSPVEQKKPSEEKRGLFARIRSRLGI